MSSASYPIVTGSKKGIQLDPRTKLLLLLTITTLMFSTSNDCSILPMKSWRINSCASMVSPRARWFLSRSRTD